MNHTADCLTSSAPRPAARRFRAPRIGLILILAALVIGLVALERSAGGDGLNGLKLETGSIPGEDWHGNVRRSTH